jgi:hypothetical protein
MSKKRSGVRRKEYGKNITTKGLKDLGHRRKNYIGGRLTRRSLDFQDFLSLMYCVRNKASGVRHEEKAQS